MSGLARREVLAALGGATVGLAGCSNSPNSPFYSGCGGASSAPEEILAVDVTDISRTDDAFSGTVSVRNRLGEDGYTRYTDVEFVAYDQHSNRVLRRPIGDLAPEDVWRETVEFDRFPFVITAAADDYEEDTTDECWRPIVGAEIRGYVGRYAPGDRLPTMSAGHVWDFLEERNVGPDEPRDFDRNRLPLGPIHTEITKCRVRNFDRNRRFQRPDLSILPDASWVDDRIAPPYRSIDTDIVHVGSETDDPDTPEGLRPRRVDARELPDWLREGLGDGDFGPVSLEDVYSLFGALEGRSFDAIRELPPCVLDHVGCRDTRWSNCSMGDETWSEGQLTYRVWYRVRHRDEEYRIRIEVTDDWRQ